VRGIGIDLWPANRLQGRPARLSRTISPDLEDTMAGRSTAKTVDELLAQARATLLHRPSPAEALHAQAGGALLVDIRGDDQRRDGLIPGAIVVPRNSLEWRCDPASQWRHPAITRRDLHIILVCNEGYQSSLAAAALQQLGLIHATDLDGDSPPGLQPAYPSSARRQPAKPHQATVTLTDHHPESGRRRARQ
jgi:rhodanese-related sulfurtransferase